MKVVTVCRMNQARSPLAEAVLKANFPEHEFFSAGIEAFSGAPVLSELLKVAKEWDITELKTHSESMGDQKENILTADLIIVSENKHTELVRQFGFKGELLSCESALPDYMFAPKDPEGMPIDKARRELGKVTGLSLRLFLNAINSHSPNKIISVTPNGSSDVSMALQAAHLEAVNRKAILMDADFRAPLEEQDLIEAGLNPVFFDFDKILENGLPILGINDILVHDKEINHPERIYLSPKWRKFLDMCTQNQELVMLTAPRYAKTRSLPDSFIVAALADEFIVIST